MIGDREQPEFGETVLLLTSSVISLTNSGINSILPLMQNERSRNRIAVPGMNLSKIIHVSL